MSVTYPDVPKSTGVPPVRRDATNAGGDTQAPLTRDSEQVSRTAAGQWGVYDDGGARALQPDNILDFEYSAEYRLADFPLEGGDLETYDKVRLPFVTPVVMTKGGSLAERTAFLKKLEAMRSDLKLYNVVTPEQTYLNVNIERVRLSRRAESGATLLTVEVGLREIRQTVNTKTSASREAAGAAPVNNGSTQTKTPSSQVQVGAIQ